MPQEFLQEEAKTSGLDLIDRTHWWTMRFRNAFGPPSFAKITDVSITREKKNVLCTINDVPYMTQPEIIFQHDGQASSVYTLTIYWKPHPFWQHAFVTAYGAFDATPVIKSGVSVTCDSYKLNGNPTTSAEIDEFRDVTGYEVTRAEILLKDIEFQRIARDHRDIVNFPKLPDNYNNMTNYPPALIQQILDIVSAPPPPL